MSIGEALVAIDGECLLDESVALSLGEGPVRIVCWQADRPWSIREADARIEAELSKRGWDPKTPAHLASVGGDQSSVLLWLD